MKNNYLYLQDGFSTDYRALKDLPLDEFDRLKYTVYVITYDWKYLYVNNYGKQVLGERSIIGKYVTDIWAEMPHINFQPIFNILKEPVEKKNQFTIKSTSPLTRKSVEIKGMPLSDCYYFSVKELPDKEALISELKTILRKPA